MRASVPVRWAGQWQQHTTERWRWWRRRRCHRVEKDRAVIRHFWPCAILSAVGGALLSLRFHTTEIAISPAVLLPQQPRAAADAGQPKRRHVVLGVPSVAVSVATWFGGPAAAGAELNPIIAATRKQAKIEQGKTSFFNPYYYKRPSGNYNSSDLQSFLPTVFLSKRNFETIEVQLENPRINTSDPVTYSLIREQNRLDPVKKLRKESYRTKLWVTENLDNMYNEANTKYERMKRALDDEDFQFLILGRTEGLVDSSARRTARRNVRAIIDGLDELIELLPVSEQEAAKVVSDTMTIPVLKLPVKNRYKKAENSTTADNATAANVTNATQVAASS